eukprot:11462861-Alexandrium_andersonii.AAC.1
MGFFLPGTGEALGDRSGIPDAPGFHEPNLPQAGCSNKLGGQGCLRDVAPKLLRSASGPVAVRPRGPRGTSRPPLG